MFPNLRAEMARRKITVAMLAKFLGKRVSTISAKMNGKSQFTLEECKAIKAFLKTELTLEELFRKEVA